MDIIGIFDGYERQLANSVGCLNLRHRSAVFTGDPRSSADILQDLYRELGRAWNLAAEAQSFRRSLENFRWFKPQLQLSSSNNSPEVTLERALVAANCRRGREDWANQVPIVSGLAGPRAGKRRAIDLVHMKSPAECEFVELKVASDTPLFAASEIVLYGLLWLLARRDQSRLSLPPSPLLAVSSLRLSVLAPQQFYRNSDISAISRFFGTGLSALGKTNGVSLSFALTAFPDDFCWPVAADDSWLHHQLDERRVL